MSLEPETRQSSCLTYDFSSISQENLMKQLEDFNSQVKYQKVGHITHRAVRPTAQIGHGLTQLT